MNELFDAIRNEEIPRIPAKWSDEFADFVAKCLIKDPEERWTFDQLLNHEFMQDAANCKDAWVEQYAQWKEPQDGASNSQPAQQ